MDQIMEMISGLITNFFGGSAMPVIREVMAKIIGLIMSIVGRVVPSAA